MPQFPAKIGHVPSLGGGSLSQKVTKTHLLHPVQNESFSVSPIGERQPPACSKRSPGPMDASDAAGSGGTFTKIIRLVEADGVCKSSAGCSGCNSPFKDIQSTYLHVGPQRTHQNEPNPAHPIGSASDRNQYPHGTGFDPWNCGGIRLGWTSATEYTSESNQLWHVKASRHGGRARRSRHGDVVPRRGLLSWRVLSDRSHPKTTRRALKQVGF